MDDQARIPMRLKISALWISVMFLYIYADIKCFYETGLIAKIMTGDIDGLIISQAFLFFGAVLMSIPIAMVFLSLVLPMKFCRTLNIILAIAHILLALAVLFVGTETWAYWYYYTALEIGAYTGIIALVVKWRKPGRSAVR